MIDLAYFRGRRFGGRVWPASYHPPAQGFGQRPTGIYHPILGHRAREAKGKRCEGLIQPSVVESHRTPTRSRGNPPLATGGDVNQPDFVLAAKHQVVDVFPDANSHFSIHRHGSERGEPLETAVACLSL